MESVLLTSIVTSRTDPSSRVTLAMAVLPEDPDFFEGDSDIELGGAGDVGDFFVSAGILWGRLVASLCCVVDLNQWVSARERGNKDMVSIIVGLSEI